MESFSKEACRLKHQIIDETFKGHKEALSIKSSDTERRICLLEKWRETVIRDLAGIEARSKTFTTIYASAIGIVLTLLTIYLHYKK